MLSLYMPVTICLILKTPRKVFGDHRIPSQLELRPGSSVSKLAGQRAARELQQPPQEQLP